MLCIGAIFGAQELEVSVIKQMPFPLADIVHDPPWVSALGAPYPINLSISQTIANYGLQVLQQLSLKAITWSMGLKNADYFYCIHFANSVVGYEYPRLFASHIIFTGPIFPALNVEYQTALAKPTVLVDLDPFKRFPKLFNSMVASLQQICSNSEFFFLVVSNETRVCQATTGDTSSLLHSQRNVVATIIVPEYLKIQNSLRCGIPPLAISANSHFDQGNRLQYSKAGTFLTTEEVTSDLILNFLVKVVNGTFSTGVKLQRLLIENSGGLPLMTKTINIVHKFGPKFMLMQETLWNPQMALWFFGGCLFGWASKKCLKCCW